MSGILRLESLTKGNTLKQGDKTPLKYRLFDADGEKLNIAGKTAVARLMYPDFLRVGYESETLTVSPDNTVTFSIDKVIEPVLYYVEITVDDKYIFPSRVDESKINIDKSSKGSDVAIIEIIGKDILIRDVREQVETEIKPVVDDMIIANQKVLENEKIVQDVNSLAQQLENRQNQVEQFNNQVITEMTDKDVISAPEIISARSGFDTLGDRLNDTTAQLAQITTNVKSFGAKGDGITDDTLAIQSAVDYLIANGGGKLFFPKGTYAISDTIYLASNITVEGVGFSSKIIPIDPTNNFPNGLQTLHAINDNHPTNTKYNGPHENIVVRNLEITGSIDVNRPRSGSVVHIQRTNHVLIENLKIIGASDGCIRVDGYGEGVFIDDPTSPYWGNSENVTIQNNECYNGFIGIEFEGGVKKGKMLNNRLYDCTRVLRLASAYDAVLQGNQVFNLKGIPDYYEGACGVNIGRSKNVQIIDNFFDVSATDNEPVEPSLQAISFHIVSVNDIHIKNNVFKNGYVGDSPQAPTGSMLGLPQSNIYIENNHFLGNETDGGPTAGIMFTEATGLVINNNFMPNLRIYVRDNATGIVENNIVSSIVKNSDYNTEYLNNVKVIYKNNKNPKNIIKAEKFTTIETHAYGGSGNNYVIQTFTIPNESSFIKLECEIINTRYPYINMGTSRIEKRAFLLMRNKDSDTVIDSPVDLNFFAINSTTAGGYTHMPALNIRVERSGTEASTETQNIQLLINRGTSNSSYFAKIDIISSIDTDKIIP